MLLFSNTTGHIVFNPSKQYLEISFAEQLENDSFVLLIDAAVSAFSGLKKEHPLIQLLIDATRLKRIHQKSLTRVAGEAISLLFDENGVRYIAFVTPQNNVDEINEFIQIANGLHFLSTFKTQSLASYWLEEKAHVLKELVTQTNRNLASN